MRVCAVQVSADNGVFGQTGPKVGSFDAGYGSSQMARLVGESAAPSMLYVRNRRETPPSTTRILGSTSQLLH